MLKPKLHSHRRGINRPMSMRVTSDLAIARSACVVLRFVTSVSSRAESALELEGGDSVCNEMLKPKLHSHRRAVNRPTSMRVTSDLAIPPDVADAPFSTTDEDAARLRDQAQGDLEAREAANTASTEVFGRAWPPFPLDHISDMAAVEDAAVDEWEQLDANENEANDNDPRREGVNPDLHFHDTVEDFRRYTYLHKFRQGQHTSSSVSPRRSLSSRST